MQSFITSCIFKVSLNPTIILKHENEQLENKPKTARLSCFVGEVVKNTSKGMNKILVKVGCNEEQEGYNLCCALFTFYLLIHLTRITSLTQHSH